MLHKHPTCTPLNPGNKWKALFCVLQFIVNIIFGFRDGSRDGQQNVMRKKIWMDKFGLQIRPQSKSQGSLQFRTNVLIQKREKFLGRECSNECLFRLCFLTFLFRRETSGVKFTGCVN